MQFTSISMLTGSLVMLGAWLFIGARMKQIHTTTLRPTVLLHNFFLWLGLFFVTMWAPQLWLNFDPSKFPLMMAWGYCIGHIFSYISTITIGRMLFVMSPRLAAKEWIIPAIGWPFLIVGTTVNITTMVFGTQPAYDYTRHLVQFHAHPAVGAMIALSALPTFLPAAVLFLRNAVRSTGSRRMRSLLLGGGFFTVIVGGPIHDLAQTGGLYMVADIVTTIGIILIGAGVLYRIEQNLQSGAPVATTVPQLSV